MHRAILASFSLGPLLAALPAFAQTTLCANIAALPATLSVPGVYCLKQDLATAITSGNAITINANSVTIDLNGFRLGGLGGGMNTQANGIFSTGRRNITIRNGTIRGFSRGIMLEGTGVESDTSGHIVEDLRIEGSRLEGIAVTGRDAVVRRNVVTDTGNGISTNATAISVEGDAATVSHNIVNRVTETGLVIGIGIYSADGGVIEGNKIRDVSGGTANYGIRSTGLQVVIKDNLLMNATTGQIGVYAQGVSDLCAGNVVTETYVTFLSGCENFPGNIRF